MSKTTDFLPICDQLVGFLSRKFPNWQFDGSAAETQNLVSLKINYQTESGVRGTVYFDENSTAGDVLRKFDLVKSYAQTPDN